MVEENFRRALLLSRGDIMVFVKQTISLGFVLACVLLIAALAYSGWKGRRQRKANHMTVVGQAS